MNKKSFAVELVLVILASINLGLVLAQLFSTVKEKDQIEA